MNRGMMGMVKNILLCLQSLKSIQWHCPQVCFWGCSHLWGQCTAFSASCFPEHHIVSAWWWQCSFGFLCLEPPIERQIVWATKLVIRSLSALPNHFCFPKFSFLVPVCWCKPNDLQWEAPRLPSQWRWLGQQTAWTLAWKWVGLQHPQICWFLRITVWTVMLATVKNSNN